MRLNACLLAANLLTATAQIVPGLSTPSPSTSSRALRTCTRLQDSLGTEVVQLSGTEYLSGASNAWNLFNTESRPTCIVFPRNAAHVQTAMTAIFLDKIHYAVQAGGHSAMSGWNTYASLNILRCTLY